MLTGRMQAYILRGRVRPTRGHEVYTQSSARVVHGLRTRRAGVQGKQDDWRAFLRLRRKDQARKTVLHLAIRRLEEAHTVRRACALSLPFFPHASVLFQEHKNLKITMCAPEWFHLRHGPYSYDTSVYQNDEEYFADIIRAYREEIADLYAAGCTCLHITGNIQIDAPLLAFFCDHKMLQGMEERGIDHVALFDLYCRVYDACLKDHPADMTFGIHLCRGNFKGGRHWSEGGYDRIAIKLFREIAATTYYLEYDTERAGTFEPLRWLPRNKSVVLGLVSSKFPKMEDKEELIARVHRAAEIIANGEEPRSLEEALNQICISPQCGFASHAEGNPVTEEDVVRKLALVVETAKAVWPDA